MLAKTLRRTGSAAHGHGHGGDHHVTTVSIPRLASYFQNTAPKDFHHHEEPNFRKKPVGWAAWNNPEYQDPFAPYSMTSPVRHVDRIMYGFWYGLGHISMKHMGPFAWKLWLRLAFCGVAGWGAALFLYSLRMSRNGWQWKNRGAVFGMD